MRIIYIDIDSARPDHFGTYGYPRRTTPNIDAIARQGLRFTNFYASDTPCLPSRTALFTGRFGINTGVVNHGGTTADLPLQDPGRGFVNPWTLNALAERLRQAGLYTASITPFPHRHSAYHIWFGFHETHDTGGDGLESADKIFPFVDDWLVRKGQDDSWFLHVNFWDPHTPYDTPAEFGNPFADDPAPGWLTQDAIDAQRLSYGTRDAVTPYPAKSSWPDIANDYGGPFTWPRGAKTIATPDDFKAWVDGYDSGLAFVDSWIGRIASRLSDLGIYDETAVIISADHGENLGELNQYGDHRCADYLTTRVPLVVRWPGVTDRVAGSSCDALLYNVDLPPTLVDLVGGSTPESWDGMSFAETLRSGADAGRDHLVLSQGTSCIQRTVRWRDYMFIRTYHTGFNDWPAFMLFDVVADPHEQHNLAREHPDLCGEAMVLMDAFVGAQLSRGIRSDPLFTVLQEGGPHHADSTDDLCRLLRDTGRDAHAAWLEANGGRPRLLN